MDFRRARSEEQRDRRRHAILETTASMLTDMAVAEVSLNELSRRVGLAKSNVLRYFESREAILLELLSKELDAWIAELQQAPVRTEESVRERGDALATLLADSLARRSVLCDLISAQAAVLERNISTDVAVAHKRATLAGTSSLVAIITRHLPELDPDEAVKVVAITIMMTSAAWPQSQPTEALRAVYDAYPDIAAMQMGFPDIVRGTLELSISGLLTRKPSRGERA